MKLFLTQPVCCAKRKLIRHFNPVFPSLLFILILTVILCGSCVRGAFSPVNVGREYGNEKLPWMVSHLPKDNQWILNRTSEHSFLRQCLCFNYACRKMAGRRKAMRAISFEDFKKRIRKNAKKGVYEKTPSVVRPVKPDTIPVRKEPEKIAAVEPAIASETPILKADSLIILNELLFETNSYKLKGEHFSALDSIGAFLKAHPTLEVSVSGHTDSLGTERHNVTLSTNRAEVVAEYLVSKGASFDRISFEGFGSSKPIMDNTTEKGRSKNRRVEILIRNPKKK